ncbi:malonyl-CoA decarboxylase [Salinicola rhizosphaerae]|uniref:MCD, Malonyl-CoA decarboxylase MCD n=1 Tax=Salinicola rhizosphaerae TaxID=1443141 RepID=A0ABQ3E5N0_9GAMM|nr:malonyl-CoA decarboxylase [Salinicola rhizosphaerae]GHB21914.1 MCD, Malonyl-CoA decarboxylase MCD [Salinicola rhizosphaerae]
MNVNMNFLQELLSSIGRRTRGQSHGDHGDKALAPSSLARLTSVCETLMQPSGEASRILIAQEALERYASLDETGKLAFFNLLAEHYSADPGQIHEAYARYRDSEDNESLQQLFSVCEPRRQHLLRRLNLCPGGTYELVRMRADLLRALKANPALAPLDADFAHLFASWFNRGFLVLESIDWNTPAAVLEKIIHYEAVHAIGDWSDLRRRLDPEDRRCYAFFHPATGDEPLIFVEVALCRGIPDNIQTILAGEESVDPAEADTAAFYSISNCQAGLKGISFGNFLIKQVVQELKRELPNLEHFVTLSPVPGFAAWLAEQRRDDAVQTSEELVSMLEGGQPSDDGRQRDRVAAEIRALAAHYLVEAKRGSGMPLDPVARFHLGNGASLHRLNWPGDSSPKGQQQSHGLMVNYLYELERIEQNHEAFSREGTVVCTSDIRRDAKQGKAKRQRPSQADA